MTYAVPVQDLLLVSGSSLSPPGAAFFKESSSTEKRLLDYTYIKYNRSELARSLQTKPFDNHLMAIIAQRIKFKDDPILKLKAGQCFVGDYEAMGLTRQSYRTALKNLEMYGLVTTKSTNKGTIVTLINSDVYDLNAEVDTTKPTSQQPTANQQLTNQQPLNKNGKKERKEEVIWKPDNATKEACLMAGVTITKEMVSTYRLKILDWKDKKYNGVNLRTKFVTHCKGMQNTNPVKQRSKKIEVVPTCGKCGAGMNTRHHQETCL